MASIFCSRSKYSSAKGKSRIIYRSTRSHASSDALLLSPSYMFDIIYVTWFVHVGTAVLGSWLWWVYLVVSMKRAWHLGRVRTSADFRVSDHLFVATTRYHSTSCSSFRFDESAFDLAGHSLFLSHPSRYTEVVER